MGVLKQNIFFSLKAIFANFYLNQFSMNNDLFPLSRLCLSTSCKAFKALPELHGWTTVPLLVKHQSWLIGYSLNCTFQSMATAFVNKCKRRRVICSKFICSKNLLNTKISTARHRLSRWQKYLYLLENQKSMPYMSCRADASLRSKWTTARIASARQKIKKMSTAWQYF